MGSHTSLSVGHAWNAVCQRTVISRTITIDLTRSSAVVEEQSRPVGVEVAGYVASCDEFELPRPFVPAMRKYHIGHLQRHVAARLDLGG